MNHPRDEWEKVKPSVFDRDTWILCSTLGMDAYLNRIETSASDLKALARSPLHYKNRMYGGYNSQAQLRGRRFHAAIEDWGRFEKEHIVAPAFDRRTKDGKLRFVEFELEHQDKTVLTRAEWDEIVGMRDSLYSVQAIRFWLEQPALREASILWENHQTGVWCKCRPDLLDQVEGVCLDFKTTKDASIESFSRSISMFGYDLAATHYLDGTHCDRYGWIAVESIPPFAACLYWLRPGSKIRDWETKRIYLLEQVKNLQAVNEYPTYYGGETIITL